MLCLVAEEREGNFELRHFVRQEKNGAVKLWFCGVACIN